MNAKNFPETESIYYKLYNNSLINITKIEENIHTIVYSLLSFFVPFFIAHPQYIVGLIVNASLILGANYIKGIKLMPIIIFPSIGVLTAGIIFNNYTIFLIYLLPFIWTANALYVYCYRYLRFKTFNNFYSILGAAGIKVMFLFSVTFIFVNIHLLPDIFLTAMGIIQLFTALTGGFLAIIIKFMIEKIKY
ncbi:MAG: hypothetical protein QXK76_00050 [Candidatus Woesearchaeota archaeon]